MNVYNIIRTYFTNKTMRKAAMEGRVDIVKLMLEKGANDYTEAMRRAALNGHMDIVKLMLEKGASNYNDSMSFAAFGDGYRETYAQKGCVLE